MVPTTQPASAAMADQKPPPGSILNMPDEDTFVFPEKHALYLPFCCEQLDQDKAVWDRQRYIEQPQLCAGDGPVIGFRALVSRHWFPGFFRQF